VFDPARPLKGGQRRFLSHQWARMYSQRHDAVLLANPVACSHRTQRVLNSTIDLGAVAEADQGARQFSPADRLPALESSLRQCVLNIKGPINQNTANGGPSSTVSYR